jgi:hypothetical protein
MIDDASVRVNELEESPEQTQATVTRLHEKPRKTGSPDRTPHRFPMNPKLPDPLIFEGRDQDLDSWLSRMRNKLLPIPYRQPTPRAGLGKKQLDTLPLTCEPHP